MRTTRSALGAAAVAALLLTSSSPARAATLSAVDGDSHASITTPIKAPADSACSRIPFAYALGADVDYAAVVILDANSAMVARSPELAAGTGTGRLGICGATLHGKASPFTLQLLVTHTEDSGKGAVTAASHPFTFVSKPIRCTKASSPGKGKVKTFTTGACPRGWTRAQ